MSKAKDIPLCKKITVTTEELAILLSCGRDSAANLGSLAQARCNVGIRNLWYVEKIK